MIENDFYLCDRSVCFEKNKRQIEEMTNTFSLKSPVAFTYLHAAADLLSDHPDDIYAYLISENQDCPFLDEIKAPEWIDKLFVATTFEHNPEFFSMAWNWIAIVDADLDEQACHSQKDNYIRLFKTKKDVFKEQEASFDIDVYASAAGVPGFNNITRIPIDMLGEIEILGNSEIKRLLFTLFVNPEYQNMKYELSIDFEAAGENYTSVIMKDNPEMDDEVSSKTVHCDFTKGIKITNMKWRLL